MEIIDFMRPLITVLSFCCFIAIALWAYSAGARKGFDEAAQLPFSEDEDGHAAGAPLNTKVRGS